MAEQAGESGQRRRAAWLLAMLVVVAILVVVVLSALLSSPAKKANFGAGPDDTLSVPPTVATHAPTSSPGPSTGPAPTAGPISSSAPATAGCRSAAPCTLQGDAGQAVAAVNAYRAQHGQSMVPGTVSAAAQACALSNGSSCTGGWAETYLTQLDGAGAVQKIARLGKLLDPKLTSFEIGWAYAPRQRTYYLAVVRND